MTSHSEGTLCRTLWKLYKVKPTHILRFVKAWNRNSWHLWMTCGPACLSNKKILTEYLVLFSLQQHTVGIRIFKWLKCVRLWNGFRTVEPGIKMFDFWMYPVFKCSVFRSPLYNKYFFDKLPWLCPHQNQLIFCRPMRVPTRPWCSRHCPWSRHGGDHGHQLEADHSQGAEKVIIVSGRIKRTNVWIMNHS